MRSRRLPELLDKAFGELPGAECTPGESYRRLVRGRTERVPASEMAGRTAAVMVVPYPPGIPVLMPGEKAGASDGPILEYLLALGTSTARSPASTTTFMGLNGIPTEPFWSSASAAEVASGRRGPAMGPGRAPRQNG
jgi:arginine decarboxylase